MSGTFNSSSSRFKQSNSPAEVRANLPKIELMSFNGSYKDWLPFYEMFKALIDSKPISDILKLHYLLICLKDDAKCAVEGFPFCAASYPLVLDTLKSQFGRKDMLSIIFNRELIDLARAGDTIKELRKTCYDIQRICRSLEAIGESTEHHLVRILIAEKLPSELLYAINNAEDLKVWQDPDYKWGTKDFLAAMERIVSDWERICLISNSSYISDLFYDYDDSNSLSDSAPLNEWSAEQPLTACAAVTKSCQLCHGMHHMRDCDQYKSPEQKYVRARQLGLCISCLRNRHRSKTCPRARPCRHCKEFGHNSYLCWRVCYVSGASKVSDSTGIADTSDLRQFKMPEQEPLCVIAGSMIAAPRISETVRLSDAIALTKPVVGEETRCDPNHTPCNVRLTVRRKVHSLPRVTPIAETIASANCAVIRLPPILKPVDKVFVIIPREKAESSILMGYQNVKSLRSNHESKPVPAMATFTGPHKVSRPHCAAKTLSLPRSLCKIDLDENASWKRRRKRVKTAYPLCIIHPTKFST